MKLTKLLIFSLTLINSYTVFAADGVWAKPQPAKSAMTIGETYYLYNQGAKGFLIGANNYSTQGSIGDKGYKVKVTKHILDNAWDGTDYEITDSVETQQTWKNFWIADSANTWVDRSNQPNYMWTMKEMGDNIYRLQGGALNPTFNPTNYPDFYVGLDTIGNPNKTTLTALLKEGTSHFLDWYFVSTADYATYLAAFDIYDEALTLKAAINHAESEGMTDSELAAEFTVYNNTNSTKDELSAAVAAVQKALAEYIEDHVNASDPKDETALLSDPSFDDNKATGWSGTTPGFQSYTNAEFYNKNYNFYQDVNNTPNGVYALSVTAFYRYGSTDIAYKHFKNNDKSLANFYAKTGTDSLTQSISSIFEGATKNMIGTGNEAHPSDTTLYVPNNMQAAEAYFNAGRYGNTMFFSTEDNNMRLGIAKDSTISTDWTIFDNFTLKYYGKSEDAYKLWGQNVKDNALNFNTLPKDEIVTTGLVDNYNQYLATIPDMTTKEQIMTAIKTRDEKAQSIQDNITAWTAYKDAVNKGNILVANTNISSEDQDDVADYIDEYYNDIINNHNISTDSLTSATKWLLAKIDAAYKNGISAGTDVTDTYLINAGFETGDDTGWSGSPTVNGPKSNKCAEAYNKSFDYYQTIKDAPIGVYEVSLKGFYRSADNATAWKAYQDAATAGKTIPCPVYVYVNNNKSTINNLYDIQIKKGEIFQTTNLVGPAPYEAPDSIYWYANDMTNAGIAFANGYYKTSAFGLVAKKGDVLRLGAKGDVTGNSQWAIFDDFRMVYQGYKADVIKPELQTAISNAEISNTTKMGKSVLSNLNSVIATGKAAVEATDENAGKTMFNALVALYAANDSVTASNTIFANLKTSYEALNNAIPTSLAAATTIEAANALITKMQDGYEKCSIENADAEDFITQANAMLTKLALPSNVDEASDENPIDLTNAIKNPGYWVDGTNSIANWTSNPTPNFGNDDTQKAAQLIEFYNKTFDISQDIAGLPEGTYTVGVHAFYRFGSASDDYDKWKAGDEGNTLLYVTTNNTTYSKPVALLASEAGDDHGYSGTTSYTKDGKTYVVPNDMVSANEYFQNEGTKYKNELTVKVGADGNLLIGVKKDTNVANDWVILDTWTLTYYGKNSTKTGIENINSEAAPVKFEYFNINGIKTTGLHHGLNIIKIYKNDGSISIKKVIVK